MHTQRCFSIASAEKIEFLDILFTPIILFFSIYRTGETRGLFKCFGQLSMGHLRALTYPAIASELSCEAKHAFIKCINYEKSGLNIASKSYVDSFLLRMKAEAERSVCAYYMDSVAWIGEVTNNQTMAMRR